MKKLFLIFILFISVFALNAQTTDSVNTVHIEIMPEFTGGQAAMNDFLDKNLTYPELAKQQGIQGKVWIGFIIDSLGNVTNVEILRGIGGGCDEEAKRVVELMPPWIPGTQDGKAVIVKFRFPINFVLRDWKPTKQKKKKGK